MRRLCIILIVSILFLSSCGIPSYHEFSDAVSVSSVSYVPGVATNYDAGFRVTIRWDSDENLSFLDSVSPSVLLMYSIAPGSDSLSSYGSTYLFKKENAPEGCKERCTDGCKYQGVCPFDAEAIYMDSKLVGYRTGHRTWPLDVLTQEVTEENVQKAIDTGRFGKCVYHCDNNVVDHQVVNLNMTDGSTMSFTMSGLSADMGRYARFYGTKGEMVVNMGMDPKDSVIHTTFFTPDRKEETIDVMSLSDDFSGHGGGDIVMVEEFADILLGNIKESSSITSLEHSVESHYCALAAEESRVNGGKVIHLDTYRQA